MRHHQIVPWLVGALLFAACGKTTDKTELMVTVWTDLAVPGQLDGVRIEVTGEKGGRVDQTFALMAAGASEPGKYTIPVRLGLAPGGAKDASITVVVTGSAKNQEIVWQRATLPFIRDNARELIVYLASVCKDVQCPNAEGKTCGPTTGKCDRPIAVPETELKPYTPGQTAVKPTEVPGGSDAAMTEVGGDGTAADTGAEVNRPDAPLDIAGPDVEMDVPLGTGGVGGTGGTGADTKATSPMGGTAGGGVTGTGGVGGTIATGGNGGITSTVRTSASGGMDGGVDGPVDAPASGGTIVAGASGGNTALGGTTGGASSTGGTTDTGGTSSAGGATAGTVASGGTSATVGGTTSTGGTTTGGTTASSSAPSPQPCDIYAANSAPCAAAHSTVRALFADYNGPLYKLKGANGNTMDIGLLNRGGLADSLPQDDFCRSNTPCTILMIYDQSGKGNHLEAEIESTSDGGSKGMSAADAMAERLTVGGKYVYSLYTKQAQAYWRDGSQSGVPMRSDPVGIYMVTSGKHYNSGYGFDYGVSETTRAVVNTTSATMNAVYFGSNMIWDTGAIADAGTPGPWIMADFGRGLFAGQRRNESNPKQTSTFVTAIEKNNGTSEVALRGGDAQSGPLGTYYRGKPPYAMDLQGAITLGAGGDCCYSNINLSYGTFYEGAIVAGYPSDATEDEVQANIVSAEYGK